MCGSASINSDPEKVSVNTVDVTVRKKSIYDENFNDKIFVDLPNGTETNFGAVPNSVSFRFRKIAFVVLRGASVTSGQSYKHFTSVNCDSRVVNYDRKVLYKIDHRWLAYSFTIWSFATMKICPIGYKMTKVNSMFCQINPHYIAIYF